MPIWLAFTRLLAVGLLLLPCLASAAVAPPAPAYRTTLISGHGRAVALNDRGQVLLHSSVWQGGQLTPLSAPGYANLTALGINGLGTVVGTARSLSTNQTVPVKWANGLASELPVVSWGRAWDVNDAGVIVGEINGRAAVWIDGQPSFLSEGVPHQDIYRYAIARAINDRNEVVGDVDGWNVSDWLHGIPYENAVVMWAVPSGDTTWLTPESVPGTQIGAAINNHGVVAGTVFDPSTMDRPGGAIIKNGQITLLTPGSNPQGINDAEDVVGLIADPLSDSTRAALWSGGALFDLNDLMDSTLVDAGWTLGGAYDVNNQGWIVGYAYNSQSGLTAAFVMTPIPEPVVPVMVVAGLLTVVLTRRQVPSDSDNTKHQIC